MALRLRLPALGWPALLLAGAALFGVLAGARPQFAIAAAVALGVVSVVMADLTLGLCAFALLTFVDLIPGGPAFSVTKVIGLVLALSWLGAVATRSRRRTTSARPWTRSARTCCPPAPSGTPCGS